jgi:predicted dienelactone hydrolase
MLDAISFEETGKPAVVVATTSFVRLANSIKRSMNLEDLPLVVISHPLGGPELARQKAQEAAPAIVKAVTS